MRRFRLWLARALHHSHRTHATAYHGSRPKHPQVGDVWEHDDDDARVWDGIGWS